MKSAVNTVKNSAIKAFNFATGYDYIKKGLLENLNMSEESADRAARVATLMMYQTAALIITAIKLNSPLLTLMILPSSQILLCLSTEYLIRQIGDDQNVQEMTPKLNKQTQDEIEAAELVKAVPFKSTRAPVKRSGVSYKA